MLPADAEQSTVSRQGYEQYVGLDCPAVVRTVREAPQRWLTQLLLGERTELAGGDLVGALEGGDRTERPACATASACGPACEQNASNPDGKGHASGYR